MISLDRYGHAAGMSKSKMHWLHMNVLSLKIRNAMRFAAHLHAFPDNGYWMVPVLLDAPHFVFPAIDRILLANRNSKIVDFV